jgi:hypothetical protein
MGQRLVLLPGTHLQLTYQAIFISLTQPLYSLAQTSPSVNLPPNF